MASTHARLLVHLVFSTKNREPQISEDLHDPLYSYLGGLVRSVDCSLLAIGGMPDHVHLLVRLHPATAVAPLMNKIKANSSRWVNEGRGSKPRFAWLVELLQKHGVEFHERYLLG